MIPITPPPALVHHIPVADYYVTNGFRYYVLSTSKGYQQTGIASWYGPKFHGKVTSSGTVYDMHGLTAASKVLPLGSRVKVENLSNHRSIIVKITDRGPFIPGRIIDLSYGTAKRIGLLNDGISKVTVTALSPYIKVPITRFPNPRYIQVGAFKTKQRALKMEKLTIRAVGTRWPKIVKDKQGRYRIWVGPFRTIKTLYNLDKALLADDINGYMVVDSKQVV